MVGQRDAGERHGQGPAGLRRLGHGRDDNIWLSRPRACRPSRKARSASSSSARSAPPMTRCGRPRPRAPGPATARSAVRRRSRRGRPAPRRALASGGAYVDHPGLDPLVGDLGEDPTPARLSSASTAHRVEGPTRSPTRVPRRISVTGARRLDGRGVLGHQAIARVEVRDRAAAVAEPVSDVDADPAGADDRHARPRDRLAGRRAARRS